MLIEKEVIPEAHSRYSSGRRAVLEVMRSQPQAPVRNRPASKSGDFGHRIRLTPATTQINTGTRRHQSAQRPTYQETRLERSEHRLFIVSSGSCVAVVLAFVVYITAYSTLNYVSIQNNKETHLLANLRSQNEQLRVEYAQLRSPQKVSAEAISSGLIQRVGAVDYISPITQPTLTAQVPDSGPTTSTIDQTRFISFNSKVASSAVVTAGTTAESH